MIRLLHGADFHLGLTRYGHPSARGNSRLDDFGATLDRFVTTGIEHEVDALIWAGDTFDSRHERPEERAALVAAVGRAGRHGITSIVEEGNHDGRRVVGDRDSSSLLWLNHVAEMVPGELIVITAPMVATYGVGRPDGKEVRISGLPYPHKLAMDAAIRREHPEMDKGDRVVEAGRRLDAAIRVMAERAHEGAAGVPSIFVGHLTVGGALTGTERSMRFEDDVAVGPGAFDGFDYAALGHIHRQQPLSAKAWYAGAPEYIDFGEEDDPKGWLLVEVEAGQDPVVTRLPTGTRRLRTFTAVEVPPPGDTWRFEPRLDALDGTIVRLLVSPIAGVRPSDLRELRKRVHDAGASYVKTIVERPEQPTDRPEVHADLDPMEATRRHLEARAVPPERVEAALVLAGQLVTAE